jgi:serine/threonine protein kinase/Flp pilus assembly protein TadD
MTSPAFQQLSEFLKKKKISLQHYQDYLRLQSHTSFDKISGILSQQQIDLQEYQNYLKQSTLLSPAAPPKALHSLDSKELQGIERLGLELLKKGKISLEQLNTLLKGFSPSELTFSQVLQALLKAHYIGAEDFVALFSRTASEMHDENKQNAQNPYKLKKSDCGLQFYFAGDFKEEQIGNYEILGELGRGGMGVVYRVYHRHLNQMLALKVLLKTSEMFVQRFYREVRIMARLSHPGIVSILDSGIHEEKPYLVMEWVQGKTLPQWLETRPPLKTMLSWMQKTLEALAYVHQQGIIHRDLKPENLFVTLQEEPKISDFGLAKEKDSNEKEEEGKKLTQSHAVLGTPQFMSPEQALGKIAQISESSDLYSLGVCFYLCLSHRLPYQEDSLKKLFEAIVHHVPAPPSRWNPEVHRDLDTLVLKCLEKEPEKRYPSAQACAEDLKRFLTGLPLLARPPSPQERLSKWIKRNPYRVYPSLFLVAFLLSLLGLFSYQNYREKKQHFEEQVFQASQEIQSAKHAKTLGDSISQTQSLLIAFHHLNQALSLNLSPPVVQQKWEVGTTLLSWAFQNEEYFFADYVAQALLPLIPQEEAQNTFLKKLETLKQRQSLKASKIFASWMQRFTIKPLNRYEKADALFEISQIQEAQIIEDLKKRVQEESHRVLEQKYLNPLEQQKAELYLSALGRMGLKENALFFLHWIQNFEKRLAPLPLAQRDRFQTHYMVLLTQALSLSESHVSENENLLALNQIRVRMGYQSNFTLRTEVYFKKLLQKTDSQQLSNLSDLSIRAYFKRNQGDIQGALNDFTLLLQQNPLASDPYIGRGELRYATGDLNGAYQDFTKAMTINPKDSSAYYNRGILLTDQHRFEEALKDFNQSLALEQAEVTYTHRGNVWQKMKQYDRALQDYNEAIRLNPKYPLAYNNRGLVKAEQGDLQGAIDDYTQALLLNPEDESAYNNRGNARQNLGDFRGALQDFDQSLFFSPNNTHAYSNRALVKLTLGDFEGARQDYLTALRLDPQDYETYYSLGYLEEDQGDTTKALRYYSKSIEINPKYPKPYHNRGVLKSKQKDDQGALQDLNQAIQCDPTLAQLYHTRGILYNSLGRLPESIQDFTQALTLNPQFKESYYCRGIAWGISQKPQKAKEDYRQYLRLEKIQKAPNESMRSWIFSQFPELREK